MPGTNTVVLAVALHLEGGACDGNTHIPVCGCRACNTLHGGVVSFAEELALKHPHSQFQGCRRWAMPHILCQPGISLQPTFPRRTEQTRPQCSQYRSLIGGEEKWMDELSDEKPNATAKAHLCTRCQRRYSGTCGSKQSHPVHFLDCIGWIQR